MGNDYRGQWKICVSEPFLNCEHIYPIQQKKVAALIADISQDATVSKIIIFGSSVTPRCHVGSDVDIYVQFDRNEKPKVNLPGYDFAYDLWSNFTVDARLYAEIERTGVTVYERDAA